MPDHALPLLGEGKAYRTPRAGEGFRTEVAGEKVAVQPRDRRSISAWSAGAVGAVPGVNKSEFQPYGSLYFWRHPDDLTYFRGVVVGVYNDLFYAKSTRAVRPIEGILAFQNFTVPLADAETIDGERIEEEELYWGRIRPGLGLGYRDQLDEPGANDNMLAISLLAEPGFLYFDSAHDTAADFIEPEETFEGRGHLQARLDALERNILELPHRGLATGGDLVYGYRSNWEDWGRNAEHDADDTRDYVSFTGYMYGAGGVPFVGSDRHRLLASIHGGTGDALDRFSAFRVGGGPSGEEFEAISRPIIPGAIIEEFTVNRYAVLAGEYRWEPIFFIYLSLRTSLSYVERDRLVSGAVRTRDDLLGSIGGRVTSGFIWDTRIQIDYNYNAGVVRHGRFGGNEIMFQISGDF